MQNPATADEAVYLNGVNVTEFAEIIDTITGDRSLAKLQFRGKNAWQECGRNLTTITGFYAAGEEQEKEGRNFKLVADEPELLLGTDHAPTPVEFLLHSLVSCLTNTIVYQATLDGIAIESIESTIEGDMDSQRLLRLREDGRMGFESIRVNLAVKSNAPAEKIRDLLKFSPVLEVVSNPTPVSLSVSEV